MTIDKNLLDRLKSRGEEVFTQVSAELMSNPRFMRAMEGALKGKERVEEAARQAVKRMNVPTRSEFKKAEKRIAALEEELAALKAKPRKKATRAKAKTAARRKKADKKAG
jgi:polyhydroxyalkanoate synthesis regulator phasin